MISSPAWFRGCSDIGMNVDNFEDGDDDGVGDDPYRTQTKSK